jgi:hypothetical protein
MPILHSCAQAVAWPMAIHWLVRSSPQARRTIPQPGSHHAPLGALAALIGAQLFERGRG